MVVHQAELRSPVASGNLPDWHSEYLDAVAEDPPAWHRQYNEEWPLPVPVEQDDQDAEYLDWKIGFGMKLKKGDWVMVWVGTGLTLQAIAGFARKARMANAFHARAVTPDRSSSAKIRHAVFLSCHCVAEHRFSEPPLRSVAEHRLTACMWVARK